MINVEQQFEQRIAEIKERLCRNLEIINPILEENVVLHAEIDDIKSQIMQHKSSNIQTEEGKIEFYIVNDGRSYGMEHYRARERFFEELGIGINGYFPETEQTAFQIALYHDGSNNEKTISAITKVLPFIKSIDGSKMDLKSITQFSIFEHTLSEYGSYSLIYDFEMDEWIISKMAWHRRSVVEEFKDLKDAIEYISMNLSYDKPHSSEEDY